METVSLKFSTKAQLLHFYSRLKNTHCTIDLRELVISSTFSADQIDLAVRDYSVRISADSLVC